MLSTNDFKGTKATLQTQYGIVSIEIPKGNLNIQELWEEIISPLLLGAGYGESIINGLFDIEGK
ncbi:MAG: hypothetical protein WC055_00920 [Melioribacteraceae bacterium]